MGKVIRLNKMSEIYFEEIRKDLEKAYEEHNPYMIISDSVLLEMILKKTVCEINQKKED